ncbi:MAG TPA: cytochrome c oxidase subunit II [Ktedonobacterales bacterium]
MNSRGSVRTPIIIWIVLSVVVEALYIIFAPILANAGAIPPIASSTSASAYQIMWIFTVLSIPVFVGVVTFLFYSLVVFRSQGRPGPTDIGPNVHGNSRLFATWLAASFVLVTVLYVVGFNGLAELEAAAPASALHVKVTAQQWLFTYEYTDYQLQSSTLYLPVNQPVEFKVSSLDVQHSFWIPELGVKADAVPGEMNTFVTTPNKVGNYTVRCMELCGVLHPYMNSPVKVISATDFGKWISSQMSGSSGWLAPFHLPEIAFLGSGGKRS